MRGCVTRAVALVYAHLSPRVYCGIVRVHNVKNQLSQKGSLKIPVHCTSGGKLIIQIITRIILLLKCYSSLKSLRAVILADFLYLSETPVRNFKTALLNFMKLSRLLYSKVIELERVSM